jgi:MFS family permease
MRRGKLDRPHPQVMRGRPMTDVHFRLRRVPISKRVNVALLCFVVLLISYCDRVNLASAAPAIMRQYQWNTVQMGWILSGFFLGYTCCLIPASLLVQKYGARLVLALGVASWSLVTALTPVPRSTVGMYCMRVLLGACESGTFPAINGLLVEWFPAEEYARAAGFCWSGGYAGPILAFPLAGMILQAWGWKAIFFVFGALGALLLVVGPRLIPARSGLQKNPGKDALKTPVALRRDRLFLSPAVLALLLLHFSSNWFAYVLLSWLPVYLQEARHFSVSSTGFGSALPFVAALIGTNLFGFFIDKLSNRHSKTNVRKSFMAIYLLGGLGLLVLPHARTPTSIVVALSLSCFFMSAASPIYASGSLDLAPRFAAPLVGIQASFANLAGILAPVASGYLIRKVSWNAVFALTAGVCLLGSAAYALLGRAEILLPRAQTAGPR